MNKDEQEKIESSRIFETSIKKEVANFITGEIYELVGGEHMSFSDEDLKKIAEICSQKNTYDVLFEKC